MIEEITPEEIEAIKAVGLRMITAVNGERNSRIATAAIDILAYMIHKSASNNDEAYEALTHIMADLMARVAVLFPAQGEDRAH